MRGSCERQKFHSELEGPKPKMDWIPEPPILNGIVEIFRIAQSPDAAIQNRVREAVDQLRLSPDGVRYCVAILVEMRQEVAEVRQMAGLLLKTMIATSPTDNEAATKPIFTDQALDYVKRMVLKALYDHDVVVRRTASSVVTTIVTKYGIECYPEALGTLLQQLQSNESNLEMVSSALTTLRMITEDELEQRWDNHPVGSDSHFAQVSDRQILPLLFRVCASAEVDPSVRLDALNILQIYNSRHLFGRNEFASHYFDQFWTLLGHLATSPVCRIRASVIKAMLTVMEYKIDPILSNAPAVFELMTQSIGDEFYDIRLYATSFWPEILRESDALSLIEPYLPRLVPLLVEQTVYSEADYQQLDASQVQDDNAAVPDQENTLAPRFHQGRDQEGDGGDDDDDDDQPDGQRAWGDKWTVRKGAALALDSLAVSFNKRMMNYCLPLIEQRLQAQQWEVRESGVLALGAISKGCLRELDQFVPNVLKLLVQLSEDTQPLLRSICCWCLNRFAPWVCSMENAVTYLEPVLKALLDRMLDRNKSVQEAAVSSIAGLEEWARTMMTPFLPQVFETFHKALDLYQARNTLILYDAIGTLAQGVGDGLVLAHPNHYSQMLLQPLFHRWAQVKPTDFQVTALAECISAIVQAIGDGMSATLVLTAISSSSSSGIEPMAAPITAKCIECLDTHLTLLQQGRATSSSNDVVEACLDLISYLAETLKERYAPTLRAHDSTLR